MAATDLTLLHRSRGSLFEAPRYDPARGVVFTDARLGGVFSLRPGSAPETVVAHRKGIGGIALHSLGGVVVTGRNLAYKAAGGDAEPSGTAVLLDPAAFPGVAGFNDLTVDTEGRLYVGTLPVGALQSPSSAGPGELCLVDLDGSARVVAPDIAIPNGAAFAPDGETLYVCDSGRNAVLSFRVDLAAGTLHDRAVLTEVTPGVADGVAVAADGSVWVAHAGAGMVGRYTSEGKLVETWTVPDALVTSLCFGGDGGRHVFITTGVDDGARDGAGEGAVYVGESDVPGIHVPLARVRPDP